MTRSPAPASSIAANDPPLPPELQARLRSGRVGLLSSQACRTTAGATSAAALHAALGGRPDHGLVRLFAAEHGWAGSIAPGATVADTHDPETGLPVYSLYGVRKRPAPTAYTDLDALVIDLRDVGVRCYTYATTAALFLIALADASLEIIVRDRPNPLGLRQSGPRTDPALRNFLAYFDTPFVHGRTLGALLSELCAGIAGFRPQLTVIPAEPADGSARNTIWHAPSPSLTHPDCLPLYPGLVLLEGTNISEGRGTDLPFRCVLAPWLEGETLVRAAADWSLAGLEIAPVTRTPAADKFAGIECGGIAFTVADANAVGGLSLGVHMLATLATQPEFAWTPGQITPRTLPWEPPTDPAQRDSPFIDYLLGSRSLREGLAAGTAPVDIMASWAAA